MIINDNVTKTQYALKIDGKIIFKNSSLSIVENYRETNLSVELKEKAIIIPVTTGNKEILLG